jgi:transcription elongation factor GreB
VSKAFTREDQDEAPIAVTARAPLPAGAVNYVTPRGLALLREEAARLAGERAAIEAEPAGDERTRALGLATRRKADVDERLASAVVVTASDGDEVRFGAAVTVRGEDGLERTVRIVGVDEASPATGRIAFVSPLARALLGRQVGDPATLRTPRGEEELEVVAIDFEAEPAG